VSKNILESITPVELLMSADIKDVTEQEWEAALDACCKDLAELPRLSNVNHVRHLQRVIATQLDSRNRPSRGDATDDAIVRSTVADSFVKYLRCYVARARKAAKPRVSSHTPPLSVDVDTSHFFATEEERKRFQEAYARLLATGMCFGSMKEMPAPAPAQHPVIPAYGRCWVKRPDRLGRVAWVICRNNSTGPFVQSAPINKHDGKWVEERWLEWLRHDTLEQAMLSLEKANCGQVLPKPADENTPWIVLTADGKLELEKVPVVDQEEAPLKPWKERPEDLYWFRVNAGYHLLDSKDPNKTWGVTVGTGRARAFYEKEQGFSPLPVVRTSGYWLFGEDDRLRITVDGKEYRANGPHQAKFIEKEKGWPSLTVRCEPYVYIDKLIAEDDAKDAEGWGWVKSGGNGDRDLLYRKENRVDVKGRVEHSSMPDWWWVIWSTKTTFSKNAVQHVENAMLALEKHYNLPRLNRP